MQIERHIFGSLRGYKTLARSVGVDATQCRELEARAFSVGQSSDPAFFQSLAGHPAYFTSELSGGRRSLSRLLPGQLDEEGRLTLLLITAILTRHTWDHELFGNVRFLLDWPELWRWQGEAELPAVKLNAPSPPRSVTPTIAARLIPLISEIERHQRSGQPMVVSASEYGLDEMAMLEVMLPPDLRRSVTTAYRALKPDFPATIVAPARNSLSHQAAFSCNGAPAVLSPFAEVLQQAGFSSGSIPLEEIMSYHTFGSSPPSLPRPRASTAMHALAVKPRSTRLPVILLMTLSIVTGAASYLVGRAQARREIRDLDQKLSQVQFDSGTQQTHVDAQIARLFLVLGKNNNDSDRAAHENEKRTEDLKAGIEVLKTRVQKLETEVEQFQAKRAETRPSTEPSPSKKGGK